ncbi:MAG: glycosyltransferase family 4 protein [Candidatus Diapherotrites archaeon]
MKILASIYYGTGFGGAERSLLTAAGGLQKRGHDVIIASTADYEGVKTAKFGKYPLPLPFFQHIWLKDFLKGVIKKEGIQIVHAQDRLTSIGAVLAARELKIPAVVHFRDYWFCCTRSTCLRREGEGYAACERCTPERLRKCVPRYRLYWEQYKLAETRKNIPLLDSANVKIAISEAVKRKMLANGFTGDIEVVPNPVDVEMFSPRLKSENEKNKMRARFGLKEGAKVVTFVGRLSYEKGILALTEIIKKILAERDDVSFLVVGDGAMRPALENFVHESKFGGRVAVAGNVNFVELPAIYANSDIVLFPSQWEEPFGRIAIEAGASGTAVIMSGVSAEILSEGKTGYLVGPQNIGEWAEKINLLLDNEKMREQIAMDAPEFMKKFTTEVIAERIEKIYERALGAGV